ncbi:MAG: alcohol dehydrogenase catalytic domain-containing protein [Gammaproteobacteria bacterium]|nr:alcohol dehydrogenase catalytic domain-containing protein [Gammaproteobacteria bacterium]MYD75886.1 alcohol dehydrogenase catalytic domain-containing protein [Gammaproteobacteria bacterium]MYJ52500.1 alcohol dehydrogenase catalytic domain-containing protein [Gammaproteobacteria bacterium]
MKALVYTAERELIYREEPDPVPAQGESVVRIQNVGICGSDMHAYLGHDERRVPPLILGHEAVGTIVEGSRSGRRVVLNPLITCMCCNYCLSGRQNLCPDRDLIGMYRPGAFAEMIAIPERNLIDVPEGMDSTKAALTEPGATALHAVTLAENAVSRPISECSTLVIGAGSVGLLTALVLKDKGALAEISETNPLRRRTVLEHTDCTVFDPQDSLPAADTYDLVFDAVGNSRTRDTAVASVRPGGVVVHIGLMDNQGGIDTRRLTLQEITFIGCYTYSPLDLRVTLEKLHSGALGTLDWYSSRPLEGGSEAFRQIHAGECGAPKVILQL